MFHLVAHRGVSAQAPENTRPAFEKMAALDLHYLETDLDLSADGDLILIHDDTLERTTSGFGRVMDKTTAELRRLDAGRWFSDNYAGTPLMLAHELAEMIQYHQWSVNWELKLSDPSRQETYLKQVAQLLRSYRTVGEVVVSSFNISLLSAFHRLMPTVKIAVLFEDELPENWLDIAQSVGASVIHPDNRTLTQNQLHAMLQAGFAVNVWTVNDPKRQRELYAWGASGIFTDFPAR
jgi:glycerophosphoryl diester phosphodiesterase